MTNSTQIIENQEVIVRFLNQDENGFLDLSEREFKMAFHRIKGDLNFGIKTTFGSVGVYQFTTLTNQELEDKFYEIK